MRERPEFGGVALPGMNERPQEGGVRGRQTPQAGEVRLQPAVRLALAAPGIALERELAGEPEPAAAERDERSEEKTRPGRLDRGTAADCGPGTGSRGIPAGSGGAEAPGPAAEAGAPAAGASGAGGAAIATVASGVVSVWYAPSFGSK